MVFLLLRIYPSFHELNELDLLDRGIYSDHLSSQWSEMAELNQGKIYKMYAPPSSHQISGELFSQIANFLKGKKCEVFVAYEY